MRTSEVAAVALGVMSVLSPGAADAAELTVLAGMGVVSGVRDVAPAFERATGHKVIVSFEAGPSLMQKVTSNAPADLVTHYPEIIDDLIKQGRVVGSRVDFARAGVGVAVKAGAPKPDISTPEAFKRAMLAAKSIAYARTGASGIITAKLMERLGLAEQLKDKTKLVDGVPVAEVVAKGEAEIGMQQINVILPVVGADYIGPLPAELQGYVDFAVGVLAISKERPKRRCSSVRAAWSRRPPDSMLDPPRPALVRDWALGRLGVRKCNRVRGVGRIVKPIWATQ